VKMLVTSSLVSLVGKTDTPSSKNKAGLKQLKTHELIKE